VLHNFLLRISIAMHTPGQWVVLLISDQGMDAV
jgi:hypothetical protein